jgi:hypothetical protein
LKKPSQTELDLSNPDQPPTLEVSGYDLEERVAELQAAGATVESMEQFDRKHSRNATWRLRLWWPVTNPRGTGNSL